MSVLELVVEGGASPVEETKRLPSNILSGCILHSSETEPEEGLADVAEVERLISSAGEADWEQVKPVGEGEEYRSEFDDDHASVLSFANSLVHGSVAAQG